MTQISGVVTFDGNPLPAATLTLTAPTGATSTATSAADGSYSFGVITPGLYELTAADLPTATAGALTIFFDGVNPVTNAHFAYTATAAATARETLAAQLIKLLPILSGALCLSAESDEILCLIDDTAEQCGIDAEQAAALTGSNAQDFKLALKLAGWEFVLNNVAAWVNFSADGGRYDRSQVFKHANTMFERLENQAYQRGICGYTLPGAVVSVATCGTCGGGWGCGCH